MVFGKLINIQSSSLQQTQRTISLCEDFIKFAAHLSVNPLENGFIRDLVHELLGHTLTEAIENELVLWMRVLLLFSRL